MRTRRVAKVLLVVLTVLVGAGLAAGAAWGFWCYRFAHRMFVDTVAKASDSLAAHHDRFMQDQARLGGVAFLAQRPGDRDAGPVIGPHVRWTLVLARGGLRTVPPADQRVGEVLERWSDEVRKAKNRSIDDWLHSPTERWKDLDFTWMARLREFDHWDLDRSAPSDDEAGLKGWEPEDTDLFTWAEYRIAKGVHDGEVLQALAEVEELARLCFTTERWTSESIGLALLGVVRRAQKAVPAAASFHSAVSQDDAEIMERALWGGQAFGQLWTPPQYNADLGHLAFGRCAALHDGAWLAYELRPDLEPSLRSDYQRLDRLLSEHPECRLRTLRDRWAWPSERTREKAGEMPYRLLEWIPAARRMEAETLVAIMAAQPYFRRYDEPPGGNH